MKNLDKNLKPSIYVQKIVLEKERQFCTTYEEKFKDETLLFADSIVCIGDKILTKANTKEEAYEMLGLQDGKYASILSAFLLKNLKKEFSLFQKQRFIFQKFDPRDLKDYVENGFYKGKAGAIMCEGFHKNYIIKQEGNLNTALGLDTQNLKAYL